MESKERNLYHVEIQLFYSLLPVLQVLPRSNLLTKVDSRIVQIDIRGNTLLISSLTKGIIYNIDKYAYHWW